MLPSMWLLHPRYTFQTLISVDRTLHTGLRAQGYLHLMG